MFNVNGKNVFITGASSGIGRAVAELFVEHGAQVVIADIVDASKVAIELGAHYVHGDVSDEMSVEAALKTAVENLNGKLDTVVLNAGVGDIGPSLEQTPQALIEKITRINQWGVLYGLKHAPSHMSDNGSIIAISSMGSLINIPGTAVYSAALAAL